MMVAPDAASENGGNLLEALVSGQFREGCVHHCDRLLIAVTCRLCMPPRWSMSARWRTRRREREMPRGDNPRGAFPTANCFRSVRCCERNHRLTRSGAARRDTESFGAKASLLDRTSGQAIVSAAGQESEGGQPQCRNPLRGIAFLRGREQPLPGGRGSDRSNPWGDWFATGREKVPRQGSNGVKKPRENWGFTKSATPKTTQSQ
jgi:hypothetical protein